MEYTCTHCGRATEGIGTRGGCLQCGKVISSPDGRVNRKAMERRMMTPRERARIALISEGA